MNIPAYLNLTIPAHARLAALRSAADGNDWRSARLADFIILEQDCANYAYGFHGEGKDRKEMIFTFTADDRIFSRERYIDELPQGKGKDSDAARGIVALLSNGRFLAGYEFGGERYYVLKVEKSLTSAIEAAARYAAEC